MRLALAQINPTIGDFRNNFSKISENIQKAREWNCDLVIFPELALLGYPPLDLLDQTGFVQESQRYWRHIQEESMDIGIICGVVASNEQIKGKPYHNSALFCAQGKTVGLFHKQLLPTYDVFDEARYFAPGKTAWSIDFKGLRLGITICEDIWTQEQFLPGPIYHYDPVEDLAADGAEILINISASPFHVGKAEQVGNLLQLHAAKRNMHIAYVNQVGGNDELIFQGRSMIWNDSGRLVHYAADFTEDILFWDTEYSWKSREAVKPAEEEEILNALILGLKDYARKCGFSGVVLGLSGGIDSAVTACLARLAFGPENVSAVAMPGPYNRPESLADARELAKRLDVHFYNLPIGELFESSKQVLTSVFQDMPEDETEENIQARLRGLVLMALSNKFNLLLLNTGNKSELAVGYCTLYGDMNGGLSVLGDVSKSMVFRLAEFINAEYEWIPSRVLSRPPSAELRPGQKDEDTLPSYQLLDQILGLYLEKGKSRQQIGEIIEDQAIVDKIISWIHKSEYKRRQAPPVLRLSRKAFGLGRRIPIAHAFI